MLSTAWHSAQRRLPEHSHESATFWLLLTGGYSEAYAHRQVAYDPFTLAFHPPGFSHCVEIGPRGARFFNVDIDACALTGACDGIAARPSAPALLRSQEMLWLVTRLFVAERQLEQDATLEVESLLTELLAAAANVRPVDETRAPRWLGRVVDYLHANALRVIRVGELAQVAGVHPTHLSRTFRRFLGFTLARYQHRLRVEHCLSDLARLDVPLSQVAIEAGFFDQSHFTKSFRSVVGVSPGVFRRTARGVES